MFKNEMGGSAPIAQCGAHEFGDSHPGLDDGFHLTRRAKEVLDQQGVVLALPEDPQALAELNAKVDASLAAVRVPVGNRVI